MNNPEEVLKNTVQRCRERDIIIPTYREMADPTLIPEGIREELRDIGLWDLNPRNLFRISWKNEPVQSGGGYDGRAVAAGKADLGSDCLLIPAGIQDW